MRVRALDETLTQFTGSIQKIRRNEVTTGDPNIPTEARLRKRAEFFIEDKYELGDQIELFDMDDKYEEDYKEVSVIVYQQYFFSPMF
mmetsp:Transcript_9143/g.9253  ORF Transcript_9143/g.9253 Transcript_9143/m.9253 type:complete len:87 (-) Transcript_9143:392-652(-)